MTLSMTAAEPSETAAAVPKSAARTLGVFERMAKPTTSVITATKTHTPMTAVRVGISYTPSWGSAKRRNVTRPTIVAVAPNQSRSDTRESLTTMPRARAKRSEVTMIDSTSTNEPWLSATAWKAPETPARAAPRSHMGLRRRISKRRAAFDGAGSTDLAPRL